MGITTMTNFRDVDFNAQEKKDKKGKDQQHKPKVYEQLCAVHGCPCTVWCGQLAQGITVCDLHEGVRKDDLGTVTAGIYYYKDLLDLAERLLRDYKLIDDYQSNYNHPHVVQALTDYFRRIGIPELAPKLNIPCPQIEGKQRYRDESAYELGNRIKKWVKAKIVKPSMIEDSEENQSGKTIEQLSPLTTYVNELKRRAIQKQQDDEAYF